MKLEKEICALLGYYKNCSGVTNIPGERISHPQRDGSLRSQLENGKLSVNCIDTAEIGM
jgi:hypothetical protein